MESDSEIKAMSLSLPRATVIAQKFEVIDYVAICNAIKSLKEDIANGIQINDDGSLVFPELGGSGITLK